MIKVKSTYIPAFYDGLKRISVTGSRAMAEGDYVEFILDRYLERIQDPIFVIGRSPLYTHFGKGNQLRDIKNGVDYFAARWCVRRDVKFYPKDPDYKKYAATPKLAPLKRNTVIAKECQLLIAFWDGVSYGTWDTIRKARRNGKIIHTFWWKKPPESVKINDWELKIEDYERWVNPDPEELKAELERDQQQLAMQLEKKHTMPTETYHDRLEREFIEALTD